MKNIIKYLGAAALIVLPLSCEKAAFLERSPFTQTSPENFFQNETQFKLALIGAYEAMNTDNVGGTTVSGGTYYCGLMQIMSSPSDEIVTSQNAADTYGVFTDVIKCNFTESTPCLRRLWDAFFVGVNRCNSIIENSSRINSELVQSYVAEARFMRGFYYWYLAQFFGGVPIAVYQSNGMEPRANLETVYKYILDDMDYAFENLPESTTAGALGQASANKWTAGAYIGRICNYLAACKRTGTGADLVAAQPLNDFAWVDADAMSKKAYDALKYVVEKSPYILIDDFRNLFRETTKEDQHKECLFMAENYLEGTENKFPTTFVFGFAPSGNYNAEKKGAASVWANYVIPSGKMFGMFSNEDPRRDWFFSGPGNGSVSDGTLIEEQVGNYKYVKPFRRDYIKTQHQQYIDSENQTYLLVCTGDAACCGKYRFLQGGQITTHTETQHGMSIPLMRLADVYLMYAEAIYYVEHDVEKARDWFRIVLDRATGHDEIATAKLMGVYYKEDFIEELLETRERELCFEGSRKYDLMRFNLLDKTLNDFINTPIGKSGDTDKYHYNAYIRIYDKKLIPFGASAFTKWSSSVRDNWRPYKIWCPISSLQIAANPNLTQNAQW